MSDQRRQILEKVAKGELDVDAAQKLLGTSENKNFRITDRGAVALLGLQRRAIVLYPNQWRKLNNKMPHLMDFLNKNQSELKQKHDAFIATLPPKTKDEITTAEETVVEEEIVAEENN